MVAILSQVVYPSSTLDSKNIQSQEAFDAKISFLRAYHVFDFRGARSYQFNH